LIEGVGRLGGPGVFIERLHLGGDGWLRGQARGSAAEEAKRDQVAGQPIHNDPV